MTRDRFDTPDYLAAQMVSEVPRRPGTVIADFAAGYGNLLDHAAARWPSCRFVATDICLNTVRNVRRLRPDWDVGRVDFLNARSRSASNLLTDVRGRVSLALLNPPFSCRGGSRHIASYAGIELTCSHAMAFILTALSFLASHGQMVMVLPTGTWTSEKDIEAWRLIHRFWSPQIVRTNGRSTFAGCYPHTMLVKLTRSGRASPVNVVCRRSAKKTIFVEVVRGTLQMHDIPDEWRGRALPLIHTTELRSNKANLQNGTVRTKRSTIVGPAVLLPRVGKPDCDKLAVLANARAVALSDCVFALRCKRASDARSVHARLLKNWHRLQRAYGGTCAPYLTRSRLGQVLSELGVGVET